LDDDHLVLHAGDLLLLSEFEVTEPLLTLRVIVDLVSGSVGDDLADNSLLDECLASGVSPNGGMYLLVDILHFASLEDLVPDRELLLELLGVIGLEEIKVGLDMSTEDV